MKSISNSLIIIVILVALTGCAAMGPQGSNQRNKTAWGTAIGTVVGAGLGQAIGGNTEGTLIGAGLGAALGGVTGNRFGAYMDQQEADLERVAMRSEMLSIQRTEEVVHATFKSEAIFAYNSAVLSPGGVTEVRRVAQVLRKYGQTAILVAGHTDDRGDEFFNQRLSEARARAVSNVLIQAGINPGRITTVGYGESQPISDNHALNRRVEITLTPNENMQNENMQ